ncbi:unnamed protein product [Orchesella dallaii]|uniref:Uncharacterized protein n=1 Tax=Orchesella dallaii TaxID=48710 RepID=A0ABP1RQE6_9HEXA
MQRSCDNVLELEDFDDPLGVLIRGLFMSRGEFLAREVRWAIDGLETDGNTLTDVIFAHSSVHTLS